MGKRILVTGGAGFIGSHLVDRLVAAGHAVTVLDDFSTGERANLAEAGGVGDVRVVEGSILDRAAVAAAMADCDRVFHLAVQCVRRSLGKPIENHDVNATGTLYLLEEARQRQVSRFLYCSSSEVYGNSRDSLLNEDTTVCEPVTVYGAAKLAGELYTKAYHRTYGLPSLVVRPFNSYGPREHYKGQRAEVIPRFLIRVLNGLAPVIFGDGSAGRDFTYVTETARGLAAAAECDALIGREINIAYGRMVTVKEVASSIVRLCQRPDIKPSFSAPRPGDVKALHADTRMAEKVLGFKAEIGFEQGLEAYMEWFGRHHPDPAALLEDKVENWDLPTDAKSR
ncbi:Nucleoside-diphosphate-sugar epimerase [Candidatus Terasakiella magnetica]|nr:Nucleoside-diphosphate-sugar epimerase [Candidatus Terasakiella magnetica]